MKMGVLKRTERERERERAERERERERETDRETERKRDRERVEGKIGCDCGSLQNMSVYVTKCCFI